MNKQPFFSIGIPVYNTEQYLEECLDSVLGQSFADFEVICVDDGSRDGSLAALHRYQQKDDRIIVIGKENGGPSTARNAALFAAKGRYMFFLDSDDAMCPDALQQAYDALVRENYPDILEAGCINSINGVVSQYTPAYPGDEYFSPQLTKDERAVKLCVDKKYIPFLPAKFINVDFLRKNGICFSHRYMMAEDNEIMFHIHRKLDTIAYAEFPASVHYSPREGSIISSPSVRSRYTHLSYELDFLRDSDFWNIDPSYRKLLLDRFVVIAQEYRDLSLTMLHGNITKEEALDIMKMLDYFISPYFRYMKLPKNKDAIIFFLYRTIGMKRTVTLLYHYLRFKGVITHD